MKLRLLKMQMLLLVARISYDQLIMMRSSDMYTVQFHIDAGRPCYLMNDDLVSKTRTRSSLTLRHHVLARVRVPESCSDANLKLSHITCRCSTMLLTPPGTKYSLHGFNRLWLSTGYRGYHVINVNKHLIRLLSPHVYGYYLDIHLHTTHPGCQSANRCSCNPDVLAEHRAHGGSHHSYREWTGEVSRHVSGRASSFLRRCFPRNVCYQVCDIRIANSPWRRGDDLSMLRRLEIRPDYHSTMCHVVWCCDVRCLLDLQLFASREQFWKYLHRRDCSLGHGVPCLHTYS